jgi:molybdopterin adenylyltransferase
MSVAGDDRGMAYEIKVGILTISDRGYRGEYRDLSGPVIRDLVSTGLTALAPVQVTVIEEDIVPDEREQIAATLSAWSGDLSLDLILTTGGTGFAPRDVTPEATRDVIDREAPGLVEAMRSASLAVTPHAMLSRAVAGIRGTTLIINLPGSPKAVRENLQIILPALPHAIELLQGRKGADLHPDQNQ